MSQGAEVEGTEVEGSTAVGKIRAPWLELVATYGEPPDVRWRTLRLWREYRRDLASNGTTGSPLARKVVAATSAHVWYRIRHGQPTAVPAGILLTLTSLATLLFLLAPSDPMPARVQVHIATGLVSFGTVLVRWPQWQPPSLLALGSFILGSGMAHALGELQTHLYPLSAVIIAGAISVGLGGVALGAFWASGHLQLRRRGFELLALGGFLIAVGDLNISVAATDALYAVACVFGSCFAALTANCLLRVRTQFPPQGGQRAASYLE